jgi:hypothetical protein
LVELEIQAHIDIWDLKGKKNLPSDLLNATKVISGHEKLRSIGIVQDADNQAEGTFTSICGALRTANLPVPTAPLIPTGSNPQITIMILPGNGRPGMLEDICLESVKDDVAVDCVNEYFQCLGENLGAMPRNLAKAQVRTFLASMGWLEEAEFNLIQSRIGEFLPDLPTQPSTAKVQVFLASRSKPDLKLGEAAQAGYWPLDHPAFDQVRAFLQML